MLHIELNLKAVTLPLSMVLVTITSSACTEMSCLQKNESEDIDYNHFYKDGQLIKKLFDIDNASWYIMNNIVELWMNTTSAVGGK